MKKSTKKLAYIFILAFCFLIVLTSLGGPEKEDNEIYEVIPANRLPLEYKYDEESANLKYNGKYIKISGIVDSVESENGRDFVVFRTSNENGVVQCELNPQAVNEAKQLSLGEYSTLSGRVDGHFGNLILSDCRVE